MSVVMGLKLKKLLKLILFIYICFEQPTLYLKENLSVTTFEILTIASVLNI